MMSMMHHKTLTGSGRSGNSKLSNALLPSASQQSLRHRRSRLALGVLGDEAKATGL